MGREGDDSDTDGGDYPGGLGSIAIRRVDPPPYSFSLYPNATTVQFLRLAAARPSKGSGYSGGTMRRPADQAGGVRFSLRGARLQTKPWVPQRREELSRSASERNLTMPSRARPTTRAVGTQRLRPRGPPEHATGAPASPSGARLHTKTWVSGSTEIVIIESCHSSAMKNPAHHKGCGMAMSRGPPDIQRGPLASCAVPGYQQSRGCPRLIEQP